MWVSNKPEGTLPVHLDSPGWQRNLRKTYFTQKVNTNGH